MDVLHTFLPIDRLHALMHNGSLQDQVYGAALFADVPGFTPLTESMAQVFGPQRGAEELTNQLNRVYTVLIDPVHRYHGSVISFSGDSINCWFDGDDGRRAAAAGLEMQEAVARLEPFIANGGLFFQPAIKVAIAVGAARRFVIGDPAIQRMDVLTGSVLEVLEKVGHLVERGMVLMESLAAAHLAASSSGIINSGEREDPTSGIRAIIISSLIGPVLPDPWHEWKAQVIDNTQAEAGISISEGDAFSPIYTWLLPAVQQRLRAGKGRLLADLRPVTVLFLSFEGLDFNDEEAELLLDAYLRKVQACLVRYEGAPMQINTGDKGNYLYAAFGAPQAHDDDAARAVTAAFDLLKISADMGFITGARVGIAHGVMFAGAYGSPDRQTYGLIGDKVNVAARLMQMAKSGEVLCDPEVYAQARRYWSFEALPPVQLKGKAAPIPVYRPQSRKSLTIETVAGKYAHSAQVDPLSPFVGRQTEVGRLEALLDDLQTGTSRVLFVEGEAGIGKSRLVAALLELANDRGLSVLLGSGQSIEQTVPYRAWRDIFQAYFDINDSDGLTTSQEKVQRSAETAVPRMLQRLPLLNEVLNLGLPETQLTAALDPKLRRESLFNLLVALLRVRIQAGPLVLILEDTHWMDVLSWELALNLIRVMLLEERPILLVLVSRPMDENHPGSQAYATLRSLPASEVIALDVLDETALAPLIAYQVGTAPNRLPSEVFQFVQMRSEGNPFFAEELVQTLHDRGLIALEPGEDGPRCVVHADLAQAGQALPDTLHGLILSRIDRLSPKQQLTIKVAAVIGRTFAYSPLRDTLSMLTTVGDDDLKGYLSELVHRELTLLEIPEPELTYIFKHIITQEAAYQSLLYAQRKEIHLAVARWYEGLLQADETLSPGLLPLLAHHYRQAEYAEKERVYARKAGEAAAQAFANDSALAYFTRALEITLPEDLESVYALRKLCLDIYTLRGNQSAASDEIDRLAEIADLLASRPGGTPAGEPKNAPAGVEKQIEVLLQRAWLLNNQGQYEAAEETVRRAKALAQKAQDTALLLNSHIELGYVLSRLARYSEAIQELEPALELARTAELQKQEAQLLHQLGVTAFLTGNRLQAQDYFLQCLNVHRMTGNRNGEGLALNNLGISYWQQGDLEAAREYLGHSLVIMREIGSRSGEVFPLANIGLILYQQRRYDEAIANGQQALILAREINMPYVEARTQGNLGSAYLATGNFALALSAHEHGLAIARATSDRQNEAYELENIAWIYLHIGDHQTADLYLEKALHRCQEIGDREIEANIERDRAIQQLWLGSPQQALIYCERALAIVQQLDMVNDKETYLIIQGAIHLQLNQLEPAAAAYQEAQKIFIETGKPATEAFAGLIRVDLARNEISKAAARAAEILAFLEKGTVVDAENPAAIYLACFQALRAAGDARAAVVLEKGYHLLQTLAGCLTEGQRQMYLENVPSNNALLALWMDHRPTADT